MEAHLQGTFLGETFEEGDTLTRSFILEHPITTHQAAFAVSSYVDSNFVHTGEYGDIPVRLTAKAEDINLMQINSLTSDMPSMRSNTGGDPMHGKEWGMFSPQMGHWRFRQTSPIHAL